MLHRQGGDHTVLAVKKTRAGRHRWVVEPETEALIRDLARLMPDKAIASLLNRLGKNTGCLNGWTQSRVCSFRSKHSIAVYQQGERAARGEVTLNEAADSLNLSPMTCCASEAASWRQTILQESPVDHSARRSRETSNRRSRQCKPPTSANTRSGSTNP
ncbi:DNA-binding protein [Mesorhizobium sp. M0045]|uniref:DNA-binding protein n=1 Tax=Mesorhizobium sp. M0045 TaxID=2956857 RepID=UPI00333ADEDB